MFTQFKPDSVKAKHMLQQENPTPSSKTSLVVSNFSSCLSYSSLNFSLSFFVYVIMYFSFDGSNFKRIKKFSSDHRLNTAASKPIGLKAENPFTPPSNICRKSQITNQPKRGDQGVHKRGNTRERKN